MGAFGVWLRAICSGLRWQAQSGAPPPDNFPGRVLRGISGIPGSTTEDIAVRHLARLGEYAEKVVPFKEDWFDRIGLQPNTVRLSVASIKIARSEFDGRHIQFRGAPTDVGTREIVVAPAIRGQPFTWQLARPKPAAQRKFQDFVEESIKRAIAQEAQVLVINEMGFPACSPARGPASADQLYEEFFLDLLRKPLGWNSHSLCIVPGTMHCFDEYTNSAPIYHYKGQTRAAGVAPDRNMFTLKVYQKKTSATAVDEFLRIPSERSLACVKLGELTITPLICLDLYDATQLFSIVRRNLIFDFHHDTTLRKKITSRVDVILVPSYGMLPVELPHVCQMLERLSLLAGCVVVLAHSNEVENEQRGFYFGKTIEEAGNNIPGVGFSRSADQKQALFEIPYELMLQKIAESKQAGGIRRSLDGFFNQEEAQADTARRL